MSDTGPVPATSSVLDQIAEIDHTTGHLNAGLLPPPPGGPEHLAPSWYPATDSGPSMF